MKIAFLTDGIYPYVIGGMQKHSYYLAKFFAQNKVNVDLYHCVPFGKPLVEKLEGFSEDELKYIKHTCIHFPAPGIIPGHYLQESWKYSSKLFVLLKNKLSDYDFIYAKGFTAWKLLAEKVRGLNCPPIGLNFHGFEMFQTPPSIKSRFEQLILKDPVKWNCAKADYVFSYGGKITAVIKNKVNIETKKIIEMPSGIETGWVNEQIKSKADPIKFLFVGRYERRKGIQELNKVLKGLIGEFNFEFNFIGPIPNYKKISSKKVIYHGSIFDQQKIKKIMRACDVLVCPSHSEGMPNVILEGMASGLAIIATDVGAVCEMVNESNGWLINAGKETALKNAMISAINTANKDLMRFKYNSLEKVKSCFLWNRIGQETTELVSELIKKRNTLID
ncbi:MAG: glycosyltransferase family 4 protein [Bacteroidota bacterium]|nr:glycosyltransferase family 4 protein [Bacteroidota bacterium]